MSDKFHGHDVSLHSPGIDVKPLSKNDNADLAEGIPRCILLSEDGDIHFITKEGTENTISLFGKVEYNFRIKKLFNTGTSSGVTVYGYY